MIQQPYASLIAFGRKRWEFRSYDLKTRGTIGIAASPSSVLPTLSPPLNRVSHTFPRGVLLAKAKLVNCFYATSSDLKKTLTGPVTLTIHGHQISTLDSPIGEPEEDVKAAINSPDWESFVWEFEEIEPLQIQIPIEKQSRSTWVSLDFEKRSGRA